MFGRKGSIPDDSIVGSPLKRQRASLYDTDEEAMKKLNAAFPAPMGNVLGLAEAAQAAHSPSPGVARAPSPGTQTHGLQIDEEEL